MQQRDQYWCKWLLFPFHIWALFCVALLLFSIWVLLLKCPSMQHGGVGLLLPNVQLHRAAQNIQYNTNSFLLNTIRQRNKMPSIWLAQRATLHHAKQNPVFQFSSCRTRMCWGPSDSSSLELTSRPLAECRSALVAGSQQWCWLGSWKASAWSPAPQGTPCPGKHLWVSQLFLLFSHSAHVTCFLSAPFFLMGSKPISELQFPCVCCLPPFNR